MEHVADGPDRVLQRPRVGRGDEEKGQVRRVIGAQLVEDLAEHLAHRHRRRRVLGEPGREPRPGGCHAGAGSRVSGTTTVGPPTRRTWASMVP